MTTPPEYPVKLTPENPDSIDRHLIHPIDYAYADRRDIDITIRHPEYTSVCPMTGLPDYGCITIHYRPNQKIVELKSLKYYFLQFRNVGIFYEHLVNRILDDLVSMLKPKRMKVEGEFTARGGITTHVSALYEESE